MKPIYELWLPWPDRRLSPNGSHSSYYAKNRARADARNATMLLVMDDLHHNPPPSVNCLLSLTCTYYPPNRARRDLDNLVARMKPYQDGLCAALGIDDAQIQECTYRWGQVQRGGAVRLELRRFIPSPTGEIDLPY